MKPLFERRQTRRWMWHKKSNVAMLSELKLLKAQQLLEVDVSARLYQ